jgi:hypothetical protein
MRACIQLHSRPPSQGGAPSVIIIFDDLVGLLSDADVQHSFEKLMICIKAFQNYSTCDAPYACFAEELHCVASSRHTP